MFDGEGCVRCGTYTKFEKLNYGADGYGFCPKCINEIEARESKFRICPDDNQKMERHFLSGYKIMIDKCSKCGGIWLENDDLQVLRKVFAEQDAAQKALMIGIMISSA